MVLYTKETPVTSFLRCWGQTQGLVYVRQVIFCQTTSSAQEKSLFVTQSPKRVSSGNTEVTLPKFLWRASLWPSSVFLLSEAKWKRLH